MIINNNKPLRSGLHQIDALTRLNRHGGTVNFKEMEMKLSKNDYGHAMKCIKSGKATDDEINFLSMMASLYVANEQVSGKDYRKLQSLTGGSLSLETPILNRQ